VNADGKFRSALELSSLNDSGDASALWPDLCAVPSSPAQTIAISSRYTGFLNSQKRQPEGDHYVRIKLPKGVDYFTIPSLSHELADKLSRMRPDNLESASKISGMTPTGITAILAHLRKSGVAA
jgi:tRNA uridine 5-carboxymethylaminomethyl modification enzyme